MARSKYTKNQLLKIGSNVASGWGGECYGCSYDKENNAYTFDCVESGEFFTTTLKEEELSEYDY